MTGAVPTLVVGAGAIGGYFGALLARAGHPVTALARGAHLEALRSEGLRIVGGPDAGRARVDAVADLAEAPPAALVLFAVKAYDSEPLARQLAGLLPDNAVVLELQNGVDRAEALEAVLGAGRVLAGTVYMESVLEAPGVIRYLSGWRQIVFGEPDGRPPTARVRRLRDIFVQAGINAQAPDDVRVALWHKLALVCAANALTALTRRPFGDIIATAEGREVTAGIIAEAAAVARASGIDLGPDVVERSVAFLEELGPALRSSMLRDIERGRPVEIDALNGAVVRRAAELGINVPRNQLVTLALRLHNEGVPT